MKKLFILFFLGGLIFSACQKDATLSPSYSEESLTKVEYSKAEVEAIFDSSIIQKDASAQGHPCDATIIIGNVQETNPQYGYWKVRIHSNSWWPITYYEFTTEGVYHITLPSNTHLGISFSATLHDWNCNPVRAEQEVRLPLACEYAVTADITFSSEFDQFSETFEAYASPNYSSGMQYGVHTDDCGVFKK